MDNNQRWVTNIEVEATKKWLDELQRKWIWGIIKKLTPEEEYENNIKLAYVFIKGQRKMVGLHKEDMKAYQLEENYPSWKIPLVEIEYTSFERWCTGMDV